MGWDQGTRTRWTVGFVCALAFGSALFAFAPAAGATTGNTNGLPIPKVLVDPGIGIKYVGRFYLSKVDAAAGIRSALFDINYTEEVAEEFIVGEAQFYQYDEEGQLTTWLASLYPFELENGKMTCNLLVSGTTNHVLGRLVMGKPSPPDTAAHPNRARIPAKLTIGGKTYEATLQQIQDESPLAGAPPTARQTGSPATRDVVPAPVATEPAYAESESSSDPNGVLGPLLRMVHSFFG